MSKPKLLIVDDEEYICKQIQWGLSSEYEVQTAHTDREALKKFHGQRPDIITLDLNLSTHDNHEKGFKVLEEILAIDPYVKIIMVTGSEGKESALNALRLGAYDYYVKPVDLSELKIILKRALYIRELEIENKRLQSQFDEDGKLFGILGNCQKIRKVISLARRVAKTDIAIFIHGESGTGKELIARAIHNLSQRAAQPFIPIDSGAIPETLLESELFGHEKGAFTDAKSQKIGKVELAHEGTLFFDEIAELPLSLQAKLLRFLQEKKIQRLGGVEFITVDVRIISASNKDLEQEILKGNFREDIYYRLNGITLELPPLREREDDIVLIATHLLEKYAQDMGESPKKLTAESIRIMKAYQWPGNIRELENKIKRALVLSTDKYIKPEDLGIGCDHEEAGKMEITLKEAREKVEKEMLQYSLEKHKGNLTKVSKSLGIARSTVYELIEKYALTYEVDE